MRCRWTSLPPSARPARNWRRLGPLRAWLWFAAAIAGVSITASSGHAINIQIDFSEIRSDEPAFDADGSLLRSLFAFAEDYYESIFLDIDHTIEIDYFYDDLDDDTLGEHQLDFQSSGRETHGDILIDTRLGSGGAYRDWFIDTTPHSNSEYNFNSAQVLWRDLTVAQQDDWYNHHDANTPDTFEVSFFGNAWSGTAADGRHDMLSVVLHEVGHALGMSARNNSTEDETEGDGDYDFDPGFVLGQTLAAETADGDDGPNTNIAHLDNANALMYPSIPIGRRRLPSHTDLFSMAAGHSYTVLDVPRREFYGGGTWDSPVGWSGGREPESDDDVWVRDNHFSRVISDGAARNLTVAESAFVEAEGRLVVDEDVTVSGAGSTIRIETGGELEADNVFLQDGGDIEMRGGTLDVRAINIRPGGVLEGWGIETIAIDVNASLINNGRIEANNNSVMTFNGFGSVWSLDGTLGLGVVDASHGDINFASGGLTSSYDGVMHIGDGHRVTIAANWRNGTGTINLNGGTTYAERAELAGGRIIFDAGTVHTDGVAEIDAETYFNPAAEVVLNDASSELRLGTNPSSDPITYAGGHFRGPGTLVQNGNATVLAGRVVEIDVAHFDWDGAVLSDTLVESSGQMNITGTSIADSYGAALRIDGGIVTVDTKTIIPQPPPMLPLVILNPWTIDGELHLSSSGILQGVLVNVEGLVQLDGHGIIKSPVDFEATAEVVLSDAGDRLELQGTTNYRGGSFGGPGRIEQDGVANVRADTTIGSDPFVRTVFDWDGSVGAAAETNIFPGTRFTLNVASIDTGDGFDGTVNVDSGVLTVNTGTVTPPPFPLFIAQPWRMEGEMNLIDSGGGIPRVSGSPVIVDGSVQVTGDDAEIAAVLQLEDGRIDVATGSTLHQLDAFSQLDGTIDVANGGRIVFQGTATFNSPGRIVNDGKIELRGTTHYYSGSYVGSGVISQYGDALIHTNTNLGVDYDFRDGSNTEIPGGLQLAIADFARVRSGATFSGGGVLRVNSTGEIQIANLADVAVTVENAGDLQFGNSPGRATLADYTQLSLGTLEIELGGTAAGSEYDQLKVLGKARLDGQLDVRWFDLGSGYAPAAGDFFDILVADRVFDEFANESLPPLPRGLEWDLIYDLSRVRLEVLSVMLFAADFDGDGDVDGEDFLTWQTGFGTTSGATHADGDADGDGDVDGEDFLTWQREFGSGTGSGAGTIPEPATFAFALLTAAVGAAVRAGRRHPPR